MIIHLSSDDIAELAEALRNGHEWTINEDGHQIVFHPWDPTNED